MTSSVVSKASSSARTQVGPLSAPPEPPVTGRYAALPLTLLLVAFPAWWLLGLGTLIFPIIAAVMGWLLLRRGNVAVPPGFGIWFLFLLSLVVSGTMLGADPRGALPESVVGLLPGYGLRLVEYVSATVIVLYVYNLSELELPTRRLVRLLGLMFCLTVAGGFLGMLAPTFALTSPVELLLPQNVRSDLFVQSLVHPAAAQLHEVFGYLTPRPAAPWGYTNVWGNNLSILLPWFVVGFVLSRRVAHRWVALAVVAACLVPAVYSLNRGLWLGLGVTALYVLTRAVLAGRLVVIGLSALAAVALLVALIATPLSTVLSARMDNGHSDQIRVFTTEVTMDAAAQSPVLGFGSTRSAIGSAQTIAVGQSEDCQLCGNPTLGSNGQVWLVLISQGYVGVALYTGFWAFGVWRFRHDRSAIGQAGHLVLVLALLYMFVYNILITPLVFHLLAYILLARNERLTSSVFTERGVTGGVQKMQA